MRTKRLGRMVSVTWGQHQTSLSFVTREMGTIRMSRRFMLCGQIDH